MISERTAYTLIDTVEPRRSPAFGLEAKLQEWHISFVLHVATGFAAVAAHYSVMWLLLKIGTGPLAASGVGFVAGAVTRFLLSHFRVFSPTTSISSALARFSAALAAQMALNLVLLEVLLGLGFHLWLSQVSATVILTFFNYVVYRFWVFR